MRLPGAIAPTRKKSLERSPRPSLLIPLPSRPGCLIFREQATHTKKCWCATARLLCWAAITCCPTEERATRSTAMRRASCCATRLPSENWHRSRSEGGRNRDEALRFSLNTPLVDDLTGSTGLLLVVTWLASPTVVQSSHRRLSDQDGNAQPSMTSGLGCEMSWVLRLMTFRIGLGRRTSSTDDI